MDFSGLPFTQPPPKNEIRQGSLAEGFQSLGFTTWRRNSAPPIVLNTNGSLPGILSGVISCGVADGWGTTCDDATGEDTTAVAGDTVPEEAGLGDWAGR